MARVCLILVAGLDAGLMSKGGLKAMGGAKVTPMRPVFPAVTCTAQATLATGETASRHGIIANGLFTHGRAELQGKLDLGDNTAEFRKQVSFWEQSNGLLESPRFWKGSGKKVAMLFWQNSMPPFSGGGEAAADVIVTPKPEHTPDGKTMTACWSQPAELYGELTAKFGPFPLHQYWSPMAGIGSTAWIVNAAIEVWKRHTPDLQLVYVPHMDYSLQKLGPGDPKIPAELAAVDTELARLIEAVRADGGVPVVVGDYAITDVTTPVLPNVALREAKLLATRPDDQGKALVDYEKSAAFAMVDHQVAHVYCKKERVAEAAALLAGLAGVERVMTNAAEKASLAIDHARAGDIVAIAKKDAWFVHDWWTSDVERPMWQFSVDIHRKPGYDPRELFFDPARKCIAQNPALVKGSHGRVGVGTENWPVLVCDAAVAPKGSQVAMTEVAEWVRSLLG